MFQIKMKQFVIAAYWRRKMDCQEAALALVAVSATRCSGNTALLGTVTKGLINMILTGICRDIHTKSLMENEIKALVREGPAPIIVTVMRSIMHSAAAVEPALRDGFILDVLVLLAENIHSSATIAKQAMQNRYKLLLATAAGQQRVPAFIVAADAAREARIESLEKAAPPWSGATVQQIEDVALMLCETLRAVCLGDLTPESRHQVQVTLGDLCETEFVDAAYATCIKEYTSEMLAKQAETAAVTVTNRKSTADEDIYKILHELDTTTIVSAPPVAAVPAPPAPPVVVQMAPSTPSTIYGRLGAMGMFDAAKDAAKFIKRVSHV